MLRYYDNAKAYFLSCFCPMFARTVVGRSLCPIHAIIKLTIVPRFDFTFYSHLNWGRRRLNQRRRWLSINKSSNCRFRVHSVGRLIRSDESHSGQHYIFSIIPPQSVLSFSGIVVVCFIQPPPPPQEAESEWLMADARRWSRESQSLLARVGKTEFLIHSSYLKSTKRKS